MTFDWYCEKLKCKMTKAACDKRLALANQNRAFMFKYFECRGCTQPEPKGMIMDEPVTKKCNKCGIEKTLDNYSKNKECRFGVEGTCKDCKKEQLAKKSFEQFLAKHVYVDPPLITGDIEFCEPVQPKTLADIKLPVTMGNMTLSKRAPNDKIIAIDFGSYPDLYNRVVELSGAEFRTPEMQIIYTLDRSLR